MAGWKSRSINACRQRPRCRLNDRASVHPKSEARSPVPGPARPNASPARRGPPRRPPSRAARYRGGAESIRMALGTASTGDGRESHSGAGPSAASEHHCEHRQPRAVVDPMPNGRRACVRGDVLRRWLCLEDRRSVRVAGPIVSPRQCSATAPTRPAGEPELTINVITLTIVAGLPEPRFPARAPNFSATLSVTTNSVTTLNLGDPHVLARFH